MRWSDGPRMRHLRSDHGCVTIAGHENKPEGVFVIGGDHGVSSVEFLEFGSNEWTKVGEPPEYDLLLHAVTPAYSPEYLLYTVGGQSRNKQVKKIYGLTHSFSWNNVASLLKERRQHTSLNLNQNDILRCF